jgi:glutamate racemase
VSRPAAAVPPRVLVFDSGVGGLTVLDEIRRRLPGTRLDYCADSAAFPYGLKSEAALVDRLPRLLAHLVERCQPQVVVVACNTASTVALPALRRALAVPVVGTVPAIKPAAAASRSRVIGLLGTPGTVRRRYTQDLIEAFAPDCRVVRHGAAELVELAEAKLRARPVGQAALRAAVEGLFAQPGSDAIDTVVLACTHFPLLRDELRATFGAELTWIDSGAAIARRVDDLLAGSPEVSAGPAPRGRAIFTAEPPELAALTPALARRGLDELEVVANVV